MNTLIVTAVLGALRQLPTMVTDIENMMKDEEKAADVPAKITAILDGITTLAQLLEKDL